MIAVVDSGGANLASVMYALERAGRKPVFTADPDIISKASHVILPGVGAAKTAIKTLHDRNLVDCIKSLTQPVLGICLGMQIMFDHSAEGNVGLLGIIHKHVLKFDDVSLTVPHMGWNTITARQDHILLRNIPDQSHFYFVHSYYAPIGDHTMALTKYGVDFTAITAHKNFFGCQFHPERSGTAGAQLLKNFTEL